MYIIIWEYCVRSDRVISFEKNYSPDGDWAKLFRKSEGYLGTELLHDTSNPNLYVTVDRWTSLQDYESFHSRWQVEYNALDKRCQNLTAREALLGTFSSIQIGY